MGARAGADRHASWTAVLFAMLLMPALTHWTPAIMMPLSVSIPALSGHVDRIALGMPVDVRSREGTPTSSGTAPALLGAATADDVSVVAAHIAAPLTTSSNRQSPADFWLLVVSVIYGVVAAAMMVRFLVGWWGAARVTRTSKTVKPPRGCLHFVRDIDAIDIRESRLIAVPVTVGLLQQTILLPIAWRRWPAETLRAALAHEVAHVKRRDVPVAFAALLNRCLFWFHPLSWWLERTLAETAEQAADEAAMSVIGDRAAYASILVDMARGVMGGRGRIAWFGIGINDGGVLNERIERALSDRATREVSRLRKAILAVTCLCAILIAVACRPSVPPLSGNAAVAQVDPTLASRLAWFLWNSGPDEELVTLATGGKLNDPAILDQQVRRMLGDERSTALISNVFNAWLFLHNVRNLKPDPLVFPDFDDDLRSAFQRETELFLESQLREDRSALELLTANYTFVNERLARHYQMADVRGSKFRRVTLDSDSPRRGLLGQASILAVTSYSTRTSAVVRGKWVQEVLLGTPTVMPTANMPRLREDEPAKPTSLRLRMELQAKDSGCARCHAWIDPLGFALENFDAIGQWRTTEGSSPIDPSAAFPDGTHFDGPGGVRRYLVGHGEQFVETIVGKLMMYALGRGGEYTPAIRKIIADAAGSNYRWSSLILGVVMSTPFQTAP